MSVQVGQVWKSKTNQATYTVFHTDGNNPPVPTNTKCAYLHLNEKKWLSFLDPQEFVTIPLAYVETYFTYVRG